MSTRHDVLDDRPCPTNSAHPTFINTKHDALHCRVCDLWLEPACTDEKCPYCPKRPEKPSMVKR
jgi:hypothetical protein